MIIIRGFMKIYKWKIKNKENKFIFTQDLNVLNPETKNKRDYRDYFLMMGELDYSTICELITILTTEEIYEYDIYIDNETYWTFYHFYNDKGILMRRYISINLENYIENYSEEIQSQNNESIHIPDCEVSNDDLFFNDFENFSFIENLYNTNNGN
jgi:hypothetical protein